MRDNTKSQSAWLTNRPNWGQFVLLLQVDEMLTILEFTRRLHKHQNSKTELTVINK